jgi:hypothetical protein
MVCGSLDDFAPLLLLHLVAELLAAAGRLAGGFLFLCMQVDGAILLRLLE